MWLMSSFHWIPFFSSLLLTSFQPQWSLCLEQTKYTSSSGPLHLLISAWRSLSQCLSLSYSLQDPAQVTYVIRDTYLICIIAHPLHSLFPLICFLSLYNTYHYWLFFFSFVFLNPEHLAIMFIYHRHLATICRINVYKLHK